MRIVEAILEEVRAWRKVRELVAQIKELLDLIKKQTIFVAEEVLGCFEGLDKEIDLADYFSRWPYRRSYASRAGSVIEMVRRSWSKLAGSVDDSTRDRFMKIATLCEQLTTYDEAKKKSVVVMMPGKCFDDRWNLVEVSEMSIIIMDEPPCIGIFVESDTAGRTYFTNLDKACLQLSPLRPAIERALAKLKEELKAVYERNKGVLEKMTEVVAPLLVLKKLCSSSLEGHDARAGM